MLYECSYIQQIFSMESPPRKSKARHSAILLPMTGKTDTTISRNSGPRLTTIPLARSKISSSPLFFWVSPKPATISRPPLLVVEEDYRSLTILWNPHFLRKRKRQLWILLFKRTVQETCMSYRPFSIIELMTSSEPQLLLDNFSRVLVQLMRTSAQLSKLSDSSQNRSIAPTC